MNCCKSFNDKIVWYNRKRQYVDKYPCVGLVCMVQERKSRLLNAFEQHSRVSVNDRQIPGMAAGATLKPDFAVIVLRNAPLRMVVPGRFS